MQYFTDVILPIPLQREFTYRISEAEARFLKRGMRVAVPFGKSKVYTALVNKIHNDRPTVYEAKDIEQILDEVPVVNEHQLKHWQWMAEYYMCSIGEVFRTAMPSAFLLESETIVQRNDTANIDESDLKDEEFLVYEALQHQSVLKVHEVSDILEKKKVFPILRRLIEKGVISLKEEIYEQYKPKLVRYVKLSTSYASEAALHQLLDELHRAPKQRQVVMTLFSLSAKTKKPIKVKDLERESGCAVAIIRSLIDKDVLEEFHIQTDRVHYSGEATEASKELNEFQQETLQEVIQGFEDKNVVLLQGVTSSGKTEVYVKLIEEALAQEKQVLYLLPEIALTTQLIDRLQNYFGEKVAVYHSRYSVNERVEVWNNVLKRRSKAQIVLGARSAVNLPFSDLGLIIVDEEHEASFKQYDPAPRYHARDAAIVLATIHGAKVLLGSATPSIESFYNANTGKYGLSVLSRRFGNVLMPDIELVDIKEKHRKKRMKGHFSDRLIEEMQESLNKGEQIILFQNRRGYAPIVECNTCGHAPQCPNCDVSLTYHQFRDQLRCHYCGYQMAMQQACLACGSNELSTKGFGTQQIEQEVKELFPDHKVARMDLDTTRGKHGFSKVISAFEQQEVDILVGTQMLTKGLDFRNVNLVGILNADALLNYPDFRAHERSFQLMQQVAGRAGRTKKRGKVIIQTYNPWHQIVQQVSSNDYASMYEDQINERRQYKYPPFFRLIRITLKQRDYNLVNEGAAWLAKALRQGLGEYVLGPEFPPVSRIRNEYHKNILVKIPEGQSLRKTKDHIQKIRNSFLAVPQYRKVKIVMDVDCY
ncbi:primosomal protein N' [Sungkyunkwania multivorans]|uniref:Replication restart protein PriA n=1 Tax=Sungkyunkwania multivorans TaxID=1173618 RepID=A0ABW3D0G6_9FLAO